MLAHAKQGAPPSLKIPYSLIREVQKSQTGIARQKTLQRQVESMSMSASQKLLCTSGQLLAHEESSFFLRTKPTCFHWLVRYGLPTYPPRGVGVCLLQNLKWEHVFE